MKDRRELESNLINSIKSIKREKNTTNEIKQELMKYDITAGAVQKWLNNPEEELPELDIRELFLFSEQIFVKTGNLNLNPDNYFTDIEKKKSRQYSASVYREEIDFPITFPHATIVGHSAYLVPVSIQTIDKMLDNQLLEYDFELQRDAVMVRKKDGSIRPQPRLIKKNVNEIETHLLNGTLVPTVLVWNAMTRSSETGDELTFDPNKLELTINKGTDLAVVDGFHRCRASQLALKKNPDLEFNFAVLITNYSKKKAQQYQAQLAKATPISTVRVQELEAKRYSDSVVQQLREESDLKGKISQSNRIRKVANELVSYNVLADTIDEEFIMNTRLESEEVGDYLVDFFNALVGYYQEEFLLKPKETREKSLINDNNMFVGYIVLARKMYEAGIKPRKLKTIIDNIDFSRDNELWKTLDVIDEKGKIERDTKTIRRNIKKFFEDIDIETGEMVAKT